MTVCVCVCVCFQRKQLWEPYNALSISELSDGEIGRIISLAHFLFHRRVDWTHHRTSGLA